MHSCLDGSRHHADRGSNVCNVVLVGSAECSMLNFQCAIEHSTLNIAADSEVREAIE